MRPRRRIRHAGGFTLIEVVIALAIAAVSLGALTAAVSQMFNGSADMRERTFASWIAHNQITELRLANVVPEVSTTTGDVTFADQEWQLETTISETGVENLFRVDVSVTLAGNDVASWQATGFIGEPTNPGGANAEWSIGFRTRGEEE